MLNFKSVLTAAGLAACALLAAAQPMVSAAKPVAVTAAPQSQSCLDACFKSLNRNLALCRRSCWVCDYSVLGICLSGHHDRECFEYCQGAARALHEACVAAC